MKTINRAWLVRHIAAGEFEVRCKGEFTDDYAWDNARDYGRTGWLPAAIDPNWRGDSQRDGKYFLDPCWFTYRSRGCGAWDNDDGIIHLSCGFMSFEFRKADAR